MLSTPKITLLYSGILGLLYFILSMNVIRYRWTQKMGIGTGEDPRSPLFRAVRVHGNFSEYIPLLLFMMALDEMTGRSSDVLHSIGLALVVGRILHWVGLTKSHNFSPGRFVGSNLVFIPMIVLSINLLLKGLA